MNGYQNPNRNAMAPWAPPSIAPAVNYQPSPPTFEGTAFAGTLGAGIAALATQGFFFLGNFQPQDIAVNAAITAGMAALGGTSAALGYRLSSNRACRASYGCQNNVSPQNAAGALRVSGRLGRWGHLDVSIPTQTISEAANIYNTLSNPQTPPVVHEYFREAADHANNVAAQAFVNQMPHPKSMAQQQPVYQQQTCPPGAPPYANPSGYNQ